MYYALFSYGPFGFIPSVNNTIMSDSLYCVLEKGLRKLIIKKELASDEILTKGLGFDEVIMTIWNDKEKVFEVDYNTTFNDLLPYIYDLPEYQQDKIKALLMELKLSK